MSKYKSLLLFFDGSWFGFLVARGPSWGVRASIEEHKALVRGFRIQVIPVPILVAEVSLESGVAVSVSPAEHETAKEFVTNRFDGGHTFDIRGSRGAGNLPGRRKLF